MSPSTHPCIAFRQQLRTGRVAAAPVSWRSGVTPRPVVDPYAAPEGGCGHSPQRPCSPMRESPRPTRSCSRQTHCTSPPAACVGEGIVAPRTQPLQQRQGDDGRRGIPVNGFGHGPATFAGVLHVRRDASERGVLAPGIGGQIQQSRTHYAAFAPDLGNLVQVQANLLLSLHERQALGTDGAGIDCRCRGGAYSRTIVMKAPVSMIWKVSLSIRRNALPSSRK